MSAMNRMCASYLRNGEAGNVKTKQQRSCKLIAASCRALKLRESVSEIGMRTRDKIGQLQRIKGARENALPSKVGRTGTPQRPMRHAFTPHHLGPASVSRRWLAESDTCEAYQFILQILLLPTWSLYLPSNPHSHSIGRWPLELFWSTVTGPPVLKA